MNSAIITDVRYRMCLPVIRSLGMQGIHVIASDSEKTPKEASLGFYSKYTKEKMNLPDPSDGPDEFINSLIKYTSKMTEKPVVIPVGIDSLFALCEFGGRLREYAYFAVPSIQSIKLANDKSALMEKAGSLNIPCPFTTTLNDTESVEKLSLRIKYPVVIKYREGELLRLDPQNRYRIVNNKEDFIKIFPEMHLKQPYPLVQKYIFGEGWGVSAVFDKESKPLKVFCHQRIREYPVSGGPSCCCKSVWNQELVDYAIKLLSELKWVGVAMVEFKGNSDLGYNLMEINPRLWGSLALSVASGCDIPRALYDAALGKTAGDKEFKPEYKINKKMRFILQDMLSVSGYLKIRKDKFKFLAGFIKDLLNPSVADGVFTLKDIPSSIQYFKQVLKKTDKIIR